MDNRKLNTNAPPMPERRSSGTSPSSTEAKKKILEKRHTLPCYKSDPTLAQVTEAVAAPLNWKHMPGRCKDKDGSEPQPPKEASVTPSRRLPPGKCTNAAKSPLEKECKVANKFRSSNKSNSLNGCVNNCDEERKDDRRVSNVEVEEDDDDIYSDALETLCPTESFSMNCSVSDVSRLDNLDAKKSRTFSTDKQTLDFMMSRFLPAAKAMTLQPPQYASRKQSVPVEYARYVNKLVCEEKKSLVSKYTADTRPYTGQCQEEEESGDEADDCEDYANISAKGCSLFPRLRIGNSLCLLNPVPGMKMRNQFPMSPAYEVSKPNKSSHIRSYSPAPAIKKAWGAIHRNKSSSGAASPDTQPVGKKWTSESNRSTYSGELLQPGRLSPFHRSRPAAAAAGISPCQSKPPSPIHSAKLLGDSKQAENNQSGKLNFPSRRHGNIQEVLSQGAKKSSNLGSLTNEKTLYIDAASTAKVSCSNSSSVDDTHRIDTVVAHLDKIRRKESNSIRGSFQDIKHLQSLEEKDMLSSEVLSSADANSSTLSSILHLMAKEDKSKGLTTDREINQELVSMQLVQGSFDEDSKINTQQIVVVDDSGKVGAFSVLSPFPPPLPKSPSESWLRRTLDSNQGTESHDKRKNYNTKSTTTYTKWETIVKTSNLHHDHERHSQELTTHKSQHLKS